MSKDLYHCYNCGKLTEPSSNTRFVMNILGLTDLDIQIRCKKCINDDYHGLVKTVLGRCKDEL